MRFKLTPDGRVFDSLIGKHFDPNQKKARQNATELARKGDPELYELIVRPTLNGGSIQFPKESGNSTPRMAGDVFTKPAKESAVITQPNEMSLLDDLRSLHGTSSSPRVIQHAGNVVRDRVYGENEEQDFLTLLAGHGITGSLANNGTVIQVGGKKLILPDTQADGRYFENKIKYPTYGGLFGLEEYRFDSLKQLQRSVPGYENIYYVINPNVRPNSSVTERGLANIDRAGLTAGQRIIAPINQLVPDRTFDSATYVAGQRREVPTHYFHASQFQPLNINTLFNV